MSFQKRDEVFYVCCRQRWMDDETKLLLRGERNRRKVLQEVIAQILVETWRNCVRQRRDEDCVSIRRRPGGDLGADVGAGARTVLDDDLLAKIFSQLLREEAHKHIGSTACGLRDDDLDWFARVVVRLRRMSSVRRPRAQDHESQDARHG